MAIIDTISFPQDTSLSIDKSNLMSKTQNFFIEHWL